jgi:hypothetical protein
LNPEPVNGYGHIVPGKKLKSLFENRKTDLIRRQYKCENGLGNPR